MFSLPEAITINNDCGHSSHHFYCYAYLILSTHSAFFPGNVLVIRCDRMGTFFWQTQTNKLVSK